jgi:hypothetical protein
MFMSVIVPLAERAGVDARLAATPPRAGSCVAYVVGATAPLASGAVFWLLLDDPVALLAIAVAIKLSAANTTSSGRSRARSLTLGLPS